MWDTYEWYLLFHCGAVLRGKCTDNSVRHYLVQNFTGLQWNGRKFFHFLSRSLDYGSMSYELGYMVHLWVVSAMSWRSSTERRKKTYSCTTQRSCTACLVTSGSMTGPQWNRRSFFHCPHWVIWTDEAWVWRWVVWTATHACSPWRHLQVRVWCMPTASTGVSTSSGDVTAGGADPTALTHIEEYHSIKLRWLDNSNIMSTIPLIIRAPNPNNQGFLSDLLMLKRPPGPDVPSSTRRLPKKSSSVFRLPAIVAPQRRRLLDGTVLSNRRNGHRDCKRTTKFGLLSRAHVAPL